MRVQWSQKPQIKLSSTREESVVPNVPEMCIGKNMAQISFTAIAVTVADNALPHIPVNTPRNIVQFVPPSSPIQIPHSQHQQSNSQQPRSNNPRNFPSSQSSSSALTPIILHSLHFLLDQPIHFIQPFQKNTTCAGFAAVIAGHLTKALKSNHTVLAFGFACESVGVGEVASVDTAVVGGVDVDGRGGEGATGEGETEGGRSGGGGAGLAEDGDSVVGEGQREEEGEEEEDWGQNMQHKLVIFIIG